MIQTLAAIAVIMRQLLRHMYDAGSLNKELQAVSSVCVDVELYRQVWDSGGYKEQSLYVREREPFQIIVT
jgi:hypothetical protein